MNLAIIRLSKILLLKATPSEEIFYAVQGIMASPQPLDKKWLS